MHYQERQAMLTCQSFGTGISPDSRHQDVERHSDNAGACRAIGDSEVLRVAVREEIYGLGAV